MSKFSVGDRVRKITGYPFSGIVCAVYDHEDKCNVKHKDKWEHIFSDKQLTYDHPEYQYLDLLSEIIETGDFREGRNGGTYSLFGKQIRFNLEEGFPLITTKRVHWKSIVAELKWFLSGDTNIKYLTDNGVTIWDEWADGDGNLGPIYGKQWREWDTNLDQKFVGTKKASNGEWCDGYVESRKIDQIANIIDGIKIDPYGRRHIVTAWNPTDIPKMALPPCHCLFQFFVSGNKLSCQLYQRSADAFLGVPFNIASYALLTHLIAIETGLEVGEFIHTFGDLHLYANHIEQAREQTSRMPKNLPSIKFDRYDSLTDFDCALQNYNPHPAIKAEVSK